MATQVMFTIKNHYRKSLVKKKTKVKYLNGLLVEYIVHLNKVCHMDLLGDLKELRV